ncbi:hypothetical protein LUZ61_017172 [Rhynchospora tenuis]|uniref:KIB1-4 beta-propeller domain-containing protein n=1 Tax=Rhynchospora tenuis TaxID=198213 RepID=A0AAD6EKS4_9POAL|nr:hypothetical protein LUZ61_017172 [Rhynchospora tenuis]
MEDLPSDFRDWAHLPPLIVELISEKVKSITDYVRFRAVCSPWRSASFPKPRHHLPPQLPWLILPYSPEQNPNGDDGTRLFYDLWESKVRKFHLPETIGMMCCASESGWLLFVATGGTELFLLNPITRARIQLPSFTSPVKRLYDFFMIPHEMMREVWDIFPSHDSSYYLNPIRGNFAISRVTFSTDLADPDCLITVSIPKFWGIFCCRIEDPYWLEVHGRHDSSVIADTTYYNGRFYTLRKGTVDVTDPNILGHNKECLCFFEEELWPLNKFLVQGKSGVYVVFVLVRKIEEEEVEGSGQKDEDDPGKGDTKESTEKITRLKFELYQFGEQSCRLRRIADTSNTALFFGENNDCLAVCTDDWDSLDGGSVYKCAPLSARGGHGSGSHYSIHLGKINDGQFQAVLCDIAKVPAISPHAPAIWFQPNFV